MAHTNDSKLDFQQILKYVYDSDEHCLRTDAKATIVGGELEVIVDHTNDSIRLGDGTDFLTSTTVGSDIGLDVNIIGGEIAIGGLAGPIATGAVTVTDTPTKIPASALSGRETVSFRNWGKNVVYFGNSSVTVANGYPRLRYEEIMMDVTDDTDVEVYAVCESGKTSEVRVMEIA
jgi:hypothetical protein